MQKINDLIRYSCLLPRQWDIWRGVALNKITINIEIYIIKALVCVFICQHYNVRTLTSPSVLKLWDTQRLPMASLWPSRGNKTNWGNIQGNTVYVAVLESISAESFSISSQVWLTLPKTQDYIYQCWMEYLVD